jgi:high-affinity iron transporter
VAVGLFFTAIVAVLTFIAHHRMPYKKMLVLTGALLGMVLIVMVGESAQELQLAHWISTTSLNLPIPGWMGVWFAVFPTAETLAAQIFAGAFVIGSYVVAQYVRVWRPRRLGQLAAQHAKNPPASSSLDAEALLVQNGH